MAPFRRPEFRTNKSLVITDILVDILYNLYQHCPIPVGVGSHIKITFFSPWGIGYFLVLSYSYYTTPLLKPPFKVNGIDIQNEQPITLYT